MCGGWDGYLRSDFLLDHLTVVIIQDTSSKYLCFPNHLYRQSSIFGLRLRPAWWTTWKGKSNLEIWHHGTRFSKCHHGTRFSKCYHVTRFSKCLQETKNDRSIAYHYLFFGIIIYGNFGNHMV